MWVHFTLSQATKALRESRGIAVLYFLTSALERGEGSASRPGRTITACNVRNCVSLGVYSSGNVECAVGYDIKLSTWQTTFCVQFYVI